MAAELMSKEVALNLDNSAVHQNFPMARWYEPVRYAERSIRHAVRLDHSRGCEEDEAHPLINKLTAGDEFDPSVLAVSRRGNFPYGEHSAWRRMQTCAQN